MRLSLNWLMTLIFVPFFYLCLIMYHPFLMLFTLFGYKGYRYAPNFLMWSLNRLLYLTGYSRKIYGKEILKNLPKGQPIIIVSNHQSMFDIPIIGEAFVKTHDVKFISKKALAKGIPSISWNLRHGKHCLIDRKDADQSLQSIQAFCRDVVDFSFGACIFVEGSRSKDGHLKPFKIKGFQTLYENLPDAMIVPIVLDNFWKITCHNLKPVGAFAKCSLHVLPPIDPKGQEPGTLLETCRMQMQEVLDQKRS